MSCGGRLSDREYCLFLRLDGGIVSNFSGNYIILQRQSNNYVHL